MAMDRDIPQALTDAPADQQDQRTERLMLNIQMEMLKTQERMLKRWASIDTWITIIGLVMLVSFIIFLFFFFIPMFG